MPTPNLAPVFDDINLAKRQWMNQLKEIKNDPVLIKLSQKGKAPVFDVAVGYGFIDSRFKWVVSYCLATEDGDNLAIVNLPYGFVATVQLGRKSKISDLVSDLSRQVIATVNELSVSGGNRALVNA